MQCLAALAPWFSQSNDEIIEEIAKRHREQHLCEMQSHHRHKQPRRAINARALKHVSTVRASQNAFRRRDAGENLSQLRREINLTFGHRLTHKRLRMMSAFATEQPNSLCHKSLAAMVVATLLICTMAAYIWHKYTDGTFAVSSADKTSDKQFGYHHPVLTSRYQAADNDFCEHNRLLTAADTSSKDHFMSAGSTTVLNKNPRPLPNEASIARRPVAAGTGAVNQNETTITHRPIAASTSTVAVRTNSSAATAPGVERRVELKATAIADRQQNSAIVHQPYAASASLETQAKAAKDPAADIAANQSESSKDIIVARGNLLPVAEQHCLRLGNGEFVLQATSVLDVKAGKVLLQIQPGAVVAVVRKLGFLDIKNLYDDRSKSVLVDLQGSRCELHPGEELVLSSNIRRLAALLTGDHIQRRCLTTSKLAAGLAGLTCDFSLASWLLHSPSARDLRLSHQRDRIKLVSRLEKMTVCLEVATAGHGAYISLVQ